MQTLEGSEPEAILARARGENFPVATRLLPQATRRHLLAIYGFARLADELGDSAPGDRLAHLDELALDLERVYEDTPQHPLLRDLQPTVRALDLPREPFQRLIEANRRDQRVARYATWEELRGYCSLSADPVGELVLRVFGAATPELVKLSDSVCTGLQLVEHLQDVAEDLAAGRLYLPAEDLARFGCDEAELWAPRASESVRELIRFEAERARGLLGDAVPLVASLRGRARIAVAGFAAGGHAALDAIEAAGWDVLHVSARPRKRDVVRRLLSTLRASRRAKRRGATLAWEGR